MTGLAVPEAFLNRDNSELNNLPFWNWSIDIGFFIVLVHSELL